MNTDTLADLKGTCEHLAPRRWPNGQLSCMGCRRDLVRLPDGSLQSVPARADGEIWQDKTRWAQRKPVRKTWHYGDDNFVPNYNGPSGNLSGLTKDTRPGDHELDTYNYIKAKA